MSQPIKVCVWELPFPPFDSTYIIVGKIESPNVTFENCLDETYEVSEQFIKIYPNPTSSVLQIELQNVIENEIDLDLYNSNGVSVIKKKYDRNFNRINLVIEDFPQGVYFLKIFINGNGYFRKILIK
ncbi:MAG: T9SS type A sorting domain-containing protein [Saprospiraceae bacterium]|nr:T9SS type A sorting domain-containing protein [Candidatus Defluviibacterium haderslevense]